MSKKGATHEKIMQRIQEAIREGTLEQPFRAGEVNRALGMASSGVFLAAHCQDTGTARAWFIRIGVGAYRLRDS